MSSNRRVRGSVGGVVVLALASMLAVPTSAWASGSGSGGGGQNSQRAAARAAAKKAQSIQRALLQARRELKTSVGDTAKSIRGVVRGLHDALDCDSTTPPMTDAEITAKGEAAKLAIADTLAAGLVSLQAVSDAGVANLTSLGATAEQLARLQSAYDGARTRLGEVGVKASAKVDELVAEALADDEGDDDDDSGTETPG